MTTVESAKKYHELLGSSVAPSPYEFSTLFRDDGLLGRQRCKRRLKLLKRIDFRLRHILESGEKVHFVTTGTASGGGERFFFGWLAYYLNRRALVFTSRRILLLHVNATERLRESVSQLSYTSIASVKLSWNGSCNIKLLHRETLTLHHLPAADRTYLVEFLADIVQLTNAPFEHKTGIEHLCPHCFVIVAKHPAACPSCAGKFKSAGTAGFLSLLFPGFGNLYLGNRRCAFLELLGAGALWYFLVLDPLIGGAAKHLTIPVDPEFWLTAAVIISLAHFLDGITIYYFARKGHYPSGVAPLPASLPPFVDRPKPDTSALNKLKISRTAPPI